MESRSNDGISRQRNHYSPAGESHPSSEEVNAFWSAPPPPATPKYIPPIFPARISVFTLRTGGRGDFRTILIISARRSSPRSICRLRLDRVPIHYLCANQFPFSNLKVQDNGVSTFMPFGIHQFRKCYGSPCAFWRRIALPGNRRAVCRGSGAVSHLFLLNLGRLQDIQKVVPHRGPA